MEYLEDKDNKYELSNPLATLFLDSNFYGVERELDNEQNDFVFRWNYMAIIVSKWVGL